MKQGSGHLGLYIEKERQQRASLFLRDVAYVIHAEFSMTQQAGTEDNVTKFEQMFIRRARPTANVSIGPTSDVESFL